MVCPIQKVGEIVVYALTTIVVLLVLQWLFVVWNLAHLRSLPPVSGKRIVYEGDRPLLSLLIPARNEERNIEACLDCVLAAVERAVASGAEIEVLVLDDRSEDATAQLVAPRAAAHPRLRLLAGDDLPPGWMGKSWACHQLARHARGRRLLFLDADARLEPDALVRVCETGAPLERGMITGFPRQVVRGAMERLVVPLMAFTIACHLPLRFVSRSADAKFAAAHGAFILIARDTYDACGGHEQFRHHLVDDVMLARAVKRVGHPLELIDVTDLINMRMYETAGEVWRGYKKNIFPGMGRNHLVFLLIFLLYAAMYIAPFIVFIYSLLSYTVFPETASIVAQAPIANTILIWSGGAYLLGVLIKAIIDYKNRIAWWHAFFLPVAILMMLLIMLDSWRTSISGQKYEWKGRHYS